MARYAPDIMEAVAHAIPTDWSKATTKYVALIENAFAKIPALSVDYAVLEKSTKVAVVACDIGWNDVGCWRAMADATAMDAQGNRLIGDVLTLDSHDCYVQTGGRTVGLVGVHDLIVVDTADMLLVANRASSQEVRAIAQRMKLRPSHAVVRPWGSYTVLQEQPGVKIKRIEVAPRQSLSLQTHAHRSEHWIVLAGRARVQNGDHVIELGPSQSTYIPAGHKHRLENPGDDVLSIIEVQCGPYLGEDDIVRYDDSYARAGSE